MTTTFGHHHLNVTDVAPHKKFFAETLGGTSIRIGTGSIDAVRFPNALVFLRAHPPTGGTKGTTVNHIAFGVPDIRQMVDRAKAAGYPIVTRAELPASFDVQDDLCYMSDQETYVAFTMAPDETKVEFIEIPRQTTPIAVHHIHFAAPHVPDMKAWYVTVLGAKPGKRGNFEAADLPCVNLTYSPAAGAVVGTKGRSLDRIGFEVKDLEPFCRMLEGRGVAFARAFGPVPELSAVATLITDPWGTSIELTQGLGEAS